MPPRFDPEMGINSWLEDELYQQYKRDRTAVDESWKQLFDESGAPAAKGGNGGGLAAAKLPAPLAEIGSQEELKPLRGAAGRIAENMAASVVVPLATSQRTIAVKVMDENRRIINQHHTLTGRGKVSYTHLIGWAVVKALEEFPTLNHAYAERDGQPYRVVRAQINLGIAVDVTGQDGGRSLLVPNINNAGRLTFQEYVARFDELVARARAGKLTPADFQGTTLSLTNPGTVGTMSSNPRLMVGQGAIIAAGAIDYPAEYQGAAEETRALLGISKVMTLTCTYDHRIIQGAESGMFLGEVQALLDGADGFYEEVFAHLKMPHQPVRWEKDRGALGAPLSGMTSARTAEIAKEAGIIQLINAYRVRGHLIADFDPLGSEPSYHPELDPETYGLTIWDLDREFLTGTLGESIGEGGTKPVATLREILETLRETYCGKIGCEYMNIQVPEQKRWLQRRMEPQANNWPLERQTRLRILRNLIAAEEFEHFLHSRFVGQKRFALEGAESALAIVEEILERASANQVHEVVIGMAHRGRLNFLANVVGKDVRQIFSEFEGELDPSSTQGSGDVKYHLGATSVRKRDNGAEIVVSMAPNPSHLEAVDPVVAGLVPPNHDRLGDTPRQRVLPLWPHDAFDHRIDGFEVTGIGRHGDHDLGAVVAFAYAGGAQMILHVARALGARRVELALEFRKDLSDVLAHHVGQEIQAAAVSHPDDDLVNLIGGGALKDLFHDRQSAFGSFQGKTLLADEARVQKVLKLFGGDQVAQNAEAGLPLERPVVRLRLHASLQPALLLWHLDVHVLAANLAAVGLAERFEDLTQRGDRLGAAFSDRLAQRPGEKFAIEIPNGQAVGFRIELGMVAGL